MTIATSTRPISTFVPITKFGAVSSTVSTYGRRACDLLESHAQDYSATVEGNAIVVHEDVELGANALATMTFLAFLRAALTENVEVRWNARISDNNGSSTLDTTPLHHLWPPTTIAVGGLPPEPAREWRAAFKYGLCYYRRGPGFVLIKDNRVADCHAHLTIDHPDLMATFLAGCTLLRDSALTPTQREAVDVLAGENLVYRVDDLLLTLPIRMRRWPVPFSAV